MRKRIVNLRPLFIALIGLIVGIILCQLIFLSDNKNLVLLWAVLWVVLFVAGLFVLTASFVIKYNKKLINFLKFHRVNSVLLILFMLVGFSVMAITINNLNSSPAYEGEFFVVGEIDDNYYGNSQYTKITLSDVVISNTEGVFKLSSKLNVYIFSEAEFYENKISANNSMSFNAVISKVPLKSEGFNLNYYINNAYYEADVISNVNYHSSSYRMDELIRNEFKETIRENMSEENANIAYSLLFGNDEVLSDNTINLFANTGVVHIISVSGLHVAVMVAVITFILSKLKVKNYLQFIIIFIILLFYSYLCGFVPTVLRSALMSLVFLFSYRVGKHYDALSSLSLSALVLLVIRPIDLFSVGFQLSFVSMFGLIALTPILNKLFLKTKIPKSIYLSINASVAATLLTMPLIAYYFNEIALYGVFSNLIIVPVLSFAYIVVFAMSFLVIPFKFLGFIYVLPEFLIHFSKIVLNLINSLPNSVVFINSDGYFSLFIIIAIVFILKYLMVKGKIKALLILPLIIVLLFSFLNLNLPKNYNTNQLHINYQSNTNFAVLTTSNNEKILIGAKVGDLTAFNKYLSSLKINKINTIIAYDYSLPDLNNLKEISNSYNVNSIYVLDLNQENYNLKQTLNFVENVYLVNNADEYEMREVAFKVLIDFDKIIGLEIVIDNNDLLFIPNRLTTQFLSSYRFLEQKYYDYVIINNIRANLNNFDIKTKYLLTHKSNNSFYDYIIKTTKFENLSFNL